MLVRQVSLLVAAATMAWGQTAYLREVIGELEKDWPASRTVNVVFHGHSVPAGYFKTPVVSSLESYPHLVRVGLARRFPHAVINVIVSARGGENSKSGAERFEADVMGHKPDLVLIDYSLNDRRLGLKEAEAAWRKMIERARSAGVKVILLTPTPDLKADLGNPEEPLEQQAAQVRKLAAEYGVGLVDSLELFKKARDKDHMGELMSQGNHPNAPGHDLVARGVLEYFEARGR